MRSLHIIGCTTCKLGPASSCSCVLSLYCKAAFKCWSCKTTSQLGPVYVGNGSSAFGRACGGCGAVAVRMMVDVALWIQDPICRMMQHNSIAQDPGVRECSQAGASCMTQQGSKTGGASLLLHQRTSVKSVPVRTPPCKVTQHRSILCHGCMTEAL